MTHPNAMTIDDQTLRKRLLFRSWHRGTREMDLILGRFAERHLAVMDRDRLDGYARLLENTDPDIYNWLTGREPRPGGIGDDLWRLLTVSFSPDATKESAS
jgi:antitoxin CptB